MINVKAHVAYVFLKTDLPPLVSARGFNERLSPKMQQQTIVD